MVEIRPLEVAKWHKKTGEELFAQPKVLQALVNPTSNTYRVNMSEEELEKYGKILGKDLSVSYTGEAHPFWDDRVSFLKLPKHTILLNPANPLDYIKIRVAQASEQVASSQLAYDNGEYPEATHYIYDEESSNAVRALKVDDKIEAYAHLAKMGDVSKANIIFLMTKKLARGKSTSFLNAEIDKLIEDNPKEFIRVVKLGSQSVTIRAQVLEMLEKNILTKDQGAICYMGDPIAVSYEDAIDYFQDPNNVHIKVKLLELLNSK